MLYGKGLTSEKREVASKKKKGLTSLKACESFLFNWI
jgi:hypothetical protein